MTPNVMLARRLTPMGALADSWGMSTMGLATAAVLLLMAVCALPKWSFTRYWGYAPAGIAGLLAMVAAVLSVV